MKVISERDLHILRDYIIEVQEDVDNAYLLDEALELIDSVLESKDVEYAEGESTVCPGQGLGAIDD